MGVVNVTPDSFSDGGKFFDPAQAVAHALELVAQGAEILDIGGESTRPGAEPVAEAEELRRVMPVIEQLAARVKIPISIDTMKPAVARAALAGRREHRQRRGGQSRRRCDVEGCGGVSAPVTFACTRKARRKRCRTNPVYADVVREVGEFFSERLGRLNACGVAPTRWCWTSASVSARRPGTICSCSRPAEFYKVAASAAARRFAQVVHREIAGRGGERTLAGVAGLRVSGGRIRRANHPRARRGGNGSGRADDGSGAGPDKKIMWMISSKAVWRPALEILILAVVIYYRLPVCARHARLAGGHRLCRGAAGAGAGHHPAGFEGVALAARHVLGVFRRGRRW